MTECNARGCTSRRPCDACRAAEAWVSVDTLEEQLARVTAERDAAVALAERLQAGWDSNAQIGTQALADLRRATDAVVEVGKLALRVEQERDNAQAENARLREALEAFAAERSWHAKYIGTWDRPEWQWRWARPERPRDFARAALAGEVTR